MVDVLYSAQREPIMVLQDKSNILAVTTGAPKSQFQTIRDVDDLSGKLKAVTIRERPGNLKH